MSESTYVKWSRRKSLNARERLCLWYYIDSGDKVTSYLKAYDTTNREYARTRMSNFLTTERAKKFMDKILLKAMKSKGVDDEWMLEHGKKAVEGAIGEKKVPGLHFMEGYTGLGETHRKGIPDAIPRGFIKGAEIPIIEGEVSEVQKKIEEHKGDGLEDQDSEPGDKD